MDDAAKRKLKWAGIGLLALIIIAYGIQHSVPYKQEAPDLVKQMKEIQAEKNSRPVGPFLDGDPDRADAYICAQTIVKRELYPSDVSFGLMGVLNASFVRGQDGTIEVIGLFNIVDYKHEFTCDIDISEGCSGTCTYM